MNFPNYGRRRNSSKPAPTKAIVHKNRRLSQQQGSTSWTGSQSCSLNSGDGDGALALSIRITTLPRSFFRYRPSPIARIESEARRNRPPNRREIQAPHLLAQSLQVSVHCRGTLEDGTEFDAEGSPWTSGWARRWSCGARTRACWACALAISASARSPPGLAVVTRAPRPRSPGGATLVFHTKLVSVNGCTGDGIDDG